jgi:predicted 3-demethylubiquinone-9 3-methyltransferase (glyoxalase superfamily)
MQPTSIGESRTPRSSGCRSAGALFDKEVEAVTTPFGLKDKYGLSWQIVPEALPRLLQQTDPAKAQRVVQALLQMKKLDIGALERAAQGA